MKNTINILSLSGLLIVFIVAAISTAYWRWSNPDMAEMRLFLTYWKPFAVMTVAFLIFAIGHNATRK